MTWKSASALLKNLVECSAPNCRSISVGKIKLSPASLISVGIFQLFVSSWLAGVVPVISDKTAQIRLSCQSVCRDLICIDTQKFATALDLQMPKIEERVYALNNLRRFTPQSVMKCGCNALSRSALNVVYLKNRIRISTIAVVSNIWFCVLPSNEQYVFTSAVGLPFASADRLEYVNHLSFGWVLLLYVAMYEVYYDTDNTFVLNRYGFSN